MSSNLFENLQMMHESQKSIKERTDIFTSGDFDKYRTPEDIANSALGIILAGLDDCIRANFDIQNDGDTYVYDFYAVIDDKRHRLGMWDIDASDIFDVNILAEISDEVNAKFSRLEIDESKSTKLEGSMRDEKLYSNFIKFTDDDNCISLKDIFNCFSIDTIQDLYDYVSSEYEEDYNYRGKINDNSEMWEAMVEMLTYEKVKLDDLFNCYSIDKLNELYLFLQSEYDDYDGEELESTKLESMDGKQVIPKIEYIQDALEDLEKYVNKNGAIPDELAGHLENMYRLADTIYENIELMKEATSGIGGAYTTKAIDIPPVGSKKDPLNEDMDDIDGKVEWYSEFSEEEAKEKVEYTKNADEETCMFDDNCLMTEEQDGKEYFIVNYPDGRSCVAQKYIVLSAYDEDYNKYLLYYHMGNVYDGDAETGMVTPEIEIGDFIKAVRV